MYRILVVEDEPEIAKGIAFLINRHGQGKWQVVGIAQDAEEALTLAAEHQPVQAVLTDIRMPGMNGLQLIEAMQHQQLCRCFAVLSGYAEFSYAQQAMTLGVRRFLTKPVEIQALQELLQVFAEELEAETRAAEQRESELLERQRRLLRNPAARPDSPEGIPLSEEVPEGGADVAAAEQTALQELNLAMDEMDQPRCNQIVHALFQVIAANAEQLTLQDLRRISLGLVLCGVRRMPEAQRRMNQYMEENLFTLERMDSFESLEELERFLCDTLQGLNRLRATANLPEKYDLIQEAKAYIQEHATKDISLKKISEHFYINASYFSALFKAKTGMKYQDYVTSVRIARAKTLLETTEMTLTDIAEAVGYSDLYYFTTMFERMTGTRPRQHRQEL